MPYRQSNGLAIYRHHSKGAPPEYMVRVRGPREITHTRLHIVCVAHTDWQGGYCMTCGSFAQARCVNMIMDKEKGPTSAQLSVGPVNIPRCIFEAGVLHLYNHACVYSCVCTHFCLSPPPPPPKKVSAVIRGSPAEVLRVLMDPHAPTSILGPALEVEVLDSSTGKQVGVGFLGGGLQAEG